LLGQPIIQHFKDFPTAIDAAAYAQAATNYARKVSSRAIAVYQVGSVRYPGLSDLDLLVVIRNPRIDNEQFFSIFNALPRNAHQLFLHQPFVVPYSCLECLRFTSHTKRKLLGGQDVASAIIPDNSQGEQWCRVFEGLCTYDSYFASIARTGAIRVRHMIAVASSLRFTLAQNDALLGTDAAIRYSVELDQLKLSILRDPMSHQVTLEIFDRFYHTFRTLEGVVRTRLALPMYQDLYEFGKQVLAAERDLPDVAPDWLRQRAETIASYHRALTALKMPYGNLFFLAAYEDRVTKFRQNRLTAKFLNAYYGLLARRA